MTERSLEELRREIDAIDDRIHDLLLARWETVRHVAAAKGGGGGLPVRPAREAAMLRRLAARHTGPFPLAALARMWHEMIAAFTMLQADYSIACFASEREHALWDLARDQFGSQVPMTPYGTKHETLGRLFAGRHEVAVLPVPREGEDEPWWIALAGGEAPKVVMRLPFAGVGSVRGEMQDALAVARLTPEATGADRTLLVVETPAPLSRGGLADMLRGAELAARYTISAERDGGWYHLVELEGFVEPEDRRLAALGTRAAVSRVSVIGAYAETLGPGEGAAAAPPTTGEGKTPT